MEPEVTIEGILERIAYVNEENNFTVAKLRTKDGRNPITIVGNLPAVTPGESLRVTGKWVVNKRFGEQFKVQSYLSITPSTLSGIERYLGSGLIKGMGPVMARRLVEQFGLETLDIIEHEPDRLLEIEGIGEVRLERIKQAWKHQKGIKEVMIFLQSYGVSASFATKIYREYQNKTIPVIKENPYRLATDVYGIGFKTADKIAQNLGIDPKSQIRAEAGILYILTELTEEGHVYYPESELVEKAIWALDIDREIVTSALANLESNDRIVIKNNSVYLKALYTAEEHVAQKLNELLNTPKIPFHINTEKAIRWIQGETGLELAERQKLAIQKAMNEKILIITGGPGTGKTTIVNSIIKILEKMRLRICLAAPTGRAAKRLSEATGREAKTIHRLLEYSPKEKAFRRNEQNTLAVDVVVIDEASMIDVLLMNHLLSAIPSHATLILIGDIDQLPSVGPGNVLKDIINSRKVEVVTLNEIFRQAESSLIVVNAHRINRGEFPHIELESKKLSDFYFIPKDEPEEVLKTIKELCYKRIPQTFGLNSLDDIQVLSPMHKGIIGVVNLNHELQALLNPYGEHIAKGVRKFRINDRVMQVRNNYEKEVYNGDVGRIIGIDEEQGEIIVRYEARMVSYTYSDLDELVLAYAVSVHKSQGTEYPAVIIPILPQHYVMLQRNLLYTGITRGKKLVVLVGSVKAIYMAIRNDKVQMRYSNLAKRLTPL
ncbi:MAG TPA: ATP-dependent RecD-like DNA helicase [Syntrophaceae bacterium]|nr:ATP-dependent RecD-like DNA helicase [Syntrophaceae bacterium]